MPAPVSYTHLDVYKRQVLGAAVVAMLVGYVGLFFGRMIKAGVSRSRETLARCV